MREECEIDARMKFELGVIDPKLAPLWMSRYGYSAKPEETGDFSSLPLRWYVRTDRPFPDAESVDGQPGAYVTAPLPFAQLDALRQGGLKMMSAIPLLD